jgi:dihydroorotate dehydrogenase electron transfer subunit
MVLATEDGSLGHSGRVTEPLARAFERRQHTSELTLYACGPTPMMRAVAELATAHGCRCLVSLEPVMGCGLGGCYSCVVAVDETSTGSHFVRACLEGPVFDARRITWSRLAESSHHGSSIAGATSRPNGARSA